MTNKKKTGRPRFKITNDICEKLILFIEQGMAQRLIAKELEMAESTYYLTIKNIPEFKDAMMQGRKKRWDKKTAYLRLKYNSSFLSETPV